MIVVGGSEGGRKAALGVAKAFAEEGIHSMAVVALLAGIFALILK